MSDEQAQELVVMPAQTPVVQQELSIEEIGARLTKITGLMEKHMEKGIDYGTVPGTSKPTLLKAGAEKLGVLFRLDPEFKTEKRMEPDGHLTVETYCTLYHQPTGMRLGGASALCTSKETKYAYRKGKRACPQPKCGKETIAKGAEKYGGGWFCSKRDGGCGTNFKDGDPAIVNQVVGNVPNENIADVFNTVVRIAEKRALVAATRMVTGASAIFDEEPDEPTADDSTRNPEPKAKGKVKLTPDAPLELVTVHQMAEIIDGVKEMGRDLGNMVRYYAKQSGRQMAGPEDMTPAEYDDFMRILEEHRKKHPKGEHVVPDEGPPIDF